jgi:capsular polysaccharide biosynthesis protein
LWKHIGLILGCALGAGLVVLVITFIVPPTYEAEAGVALVKTGVDLNFDPKFKTISELDATTGLIDQSARRKALATIASSPDVATEVIALLGGHVPDALREPANMVRAVNARSDGDLIRISVRAGSAEQAALIANTWAHVFVNRVNAIYGSGPLTSSELQAQADTYKKGYDQTETALVSYLASNPTSQLQRVLQEKQATLTDSLLVGNRLDRTLADAQALRERLAADPTDSGLGNELAKLVLEANSFSAATNLSTSTQPGSISPITLQFQIDSQQLNANPTQMLGDVDSLIKTLVARREQIRANDVTQLQQDVNQLLSQLEQEHAREQELTHARDLAWDTYTTLATKVAEVTVAEQSKGNIVQTAITAVNPQEPVEPRRALYTVLATIAGFVLGLALAFLPEVVKNLPRSRATMQPRSELPLSP